MVPKPISFEELTALVQTINSLLEKNKAPYRLTTEISRNANHFVTDMVSTDLLRPHIKSISLVDLQEETATPKESLQTQMKFLKNLDEQYQQYAYNNFGRMQESVEKINSHINNDKFPFKLMLVGGEGNFTGLNLVDNKSKKQIPIKLSPATLNTLCSPSDEKHADGVVIVLSLLTKEYQKQLVEKETTSKIAARGVWKRTTPSAEISKAMQSAAIQYMNSNHGKTGIKEFDVLGDNYQVTVIRPSESNKKGEVSLMIEDVYVNKSNPSPPIIVSVSANTVREFAEKKNFPTLKPK